MCISRVNWSSEHSVDSSWIKTNLIDNEIVTFALKSGPFIVFSRSLNYIIIFISNPLSPCCSDPQVCPTVCDPWITASQTSLSFIITWSLLKLMSIESVMPSTISSSVVPFSSCRQSFPASGSFPMSWIFTSGSQSIGVSASTSVLPMNIQDWFPLGLTGLISLQSKGLSRVFSNTTVPNHQFSGTRLLYDPVLTYIHDYWENHRFDYTDLCWQSDDSAF